MGPIGCSETSLRNYHYSLRNNPAERSSFLEGLSEKCVYRFMRYSLGKRLPMLKLQDPLMCMILPQATPPCFIEGTFIVCIPILCQLE